MRPEARKQLGYYPAPPAAIRAILPRLTLGTGGPTALLDPCAGEGLAIQVLAQGLGLPDERLWLVELDRDRGAACQQTLPGAKVLSPCSFLQTDIRHQSFGLAYVNPPFDDSLTQGLRVEEEFLREALKLLTTGGILLFVCPEDVVHRYGFRKLLERYCQNISFTPFPRLERRYREVFILAERVEGWHPEGTAFLDLQAPDHWVYRIPPAAGPGTRFRKTGLTDDELLEALAASPLLDEFDAPQAFALPSPPLALGKGQLALLLASGHLDALVTLDGQSHVVRGTAKKVEEKTDESVDKTSTTTVTKTIWTERIKLAVRVVWPDGDIVTLE